MIVNESTVLRLGGVLIKKLYKGGVLIYNLLAKLLYAAPFTYTLDVNGNNLLTNQGSGADMLMYSGRYLDLVNQPLPIPIHHTLGLDTKQVATLGAGWTDNTGHSYTGATASSSLSNLSTVVSAPSVLIDFTITAYTSGSVGGKSALGTYTIESTSESLTGVSFVGTVLINSVKQITNPNSYLTYADMTTNTFTYLDMSALTPSQTYTFDNLKLNNILVHKNPLIAADRAVIEANPNLLGKLGINGSASELSHVLDVSDKYYGCMEISDKLVVDASIGASSSNLFTYSEEFNLWGNNATIITTDTTETLDPIGTNTADIFIKNTANNYHYLSKTITGYGIGDIYTYSIYAKARENSTASLYFAGGDFSYVNSALNLLTGAITGQGKATSIGNGWYRFTLSATCTATTVGTTNIRITDNQAFVIGDGTSGIYIWGGQAEKGAISAGYIKTTASAIIGTPIAFSEIANYTTNARKKSHNKGIQTSAFTLDSIGVPTAYDVSKFNFYSYEKGNVQINLSTVGNFWLEEVIGTTIYQHKFDGTNLTTYTNNVAGTAIAHSPENVVYELGRGVYPKLAINPLATYTVPKFNLHTDVSYTVYNQATRYTEMGGI